VAFHQGKEFCDQFGIVKALSRLFQHCSFCLPVAERWLVWTGSAEGVIDIDNLQHAGQQRDVVARETVGVSGSIPVFMVMTNDGKHAPERLEGLADGLASHWLLADDLPFFIGKAGVLLENFVGNGHLPQIMKITPALQSNNALVVKAEMTPQIAGIARQS